MTKPSLLTKKQKHFYEVLKTYIKKHSVSPTVQELQTLLNFSSPRAVSQYIESLERKGLITRASYEARGIKLREMEPYELEQVQIPVMASAGCDNVSVFAQQTFDEYMCIPKDSLNGKRADNVVVIKAVGDSMVDAGIEQGDHVLVEVTEAVSEGDLVVAIIDSFAVIKKLEKANNAFILKPVSSDSQYKPIILNQHFRFFGKVIDVIRREQKGDVEVVPLMSNY